jgi:hypothetical protein
MAARQPSWILLLRVILVQQYTFCNNKISSVLLIPNLARCSLLQSLTDVLVAFSYTYTYTYRVMIHPSHPNEVDGEKIQVEQHLGQQGMWLFIGQKNILFLVYVHVSYDPSASVFFGSPGEPVQSHIVHYPSSSSVRTACFVAAGTIDPKHCTYVPLGKSTLQTKILGLATRGPKPKIQKVLN